MFKNKKYTFTTLVLSKCKSLSWRRDVVSPYLLNYGPNQCLKSNPVIHRLSLETHPNIVHRSGARSIEARHRLKDVETTMLHKVVEVSDVLQ